MANILDSKAAWPSTPQAYTVLYLVFAQTDGEDYLCVSLNELANNVWDGLVAAG